MQKSTIEERVSLLEIQVEEIEEDVADLDQDVNFLSDEQVIQDARLLELEWTSNDVIVELTEINANILGNYHLQRSWGKVMFLHMSVILSTGGESTWAGTPWDQVHTPNQVHPLGPGTPLRTRYTPRPGTPLGPDTLPPGPGTHTPRPGTPSPRPGTPPRQGTPNTQYQQMATVVDDMHSCLNTVTHFKT